MTGGNGRCTIFGVSPRLPHPTALLPSLLAPATHSPLPLSVKKPSYVGTRVSRLGWGKSVVFASRSLDVSNSALQPEAFSEGGKLVWPNAELLGIKPAAEVKVSAKVLSRGGRAGEEGVRP